MAGQIAEFGAAALVNHLSGQSVPVVAASPPSWFPGLIWIDTSSGNAVKGWNGSAWVTGAGNRFLALLSADPVAGAAVNLTDLTEITTAGYSRQSVTFAHSSTAYPSSTSNTNLITFGPMSAGMVNAVQWVAMVTVASGTTGYFLMSWLMPAAVQVNSSQVIQIGIGALVIENQ